MQIFQTMQRKFTKLGAMGRRAFSPKTSFPLAAACISGLLNCGSLSAEPLLMSVDPFELKADQQTSLGLYLTTAEAHSYVKGTPEILFLDARSRAEVNFLGLPDSVDANIPFGMMHPGYLLGDDGQSYNRSKNKYFVEAVRELIERKGLGRDPVIFVMCRDSHGVARVVNKLAGRGFTRVYAIVDGFEGDKGANGRRSINGWKNAGLPWSYGIGAERAYRPPMEAIEDKLSH